MKNTDNKICIIGTGGFAKETLCCLLDIWKSKKIDPTDRVIFMEKDDKYIAGKIMGFEIIPQSQLDFKNYSLTVAIGDPKLRKNVVDSLPLNCTFENIIHPSAIISEWVKIGAGCIITAGVVLTCDISIGKQCHLNLLTTIGHDCTIGDYFTSAPSVNISGSCKLGNSIYIGTNASLKQGLTICDDVVIGMGALVLKDINQKGTYVGNPLRPI